MKLDPRSTASAFRSRRLLFALVCLPVLFALAEPPAWWTERQVLDPNAAKNDYGPANQGQLKNIATKAYAELQAKLPASAWNTPEGQALGVLITSWNPAQGDNYAPINQGQLKAVAKKFYDVLIQAGYTSAYPWTTTTTDDTNYAPANIGQVKNMFAFDLGSTSDSDGNGLPDYWEIANFGHIGVDPNALAARGDGLTILQAFQQGLDPNDYYNGQTPFPVFRSRSSGASKRKCGFSPFRIITCVYPFEDLGWSNFRHFPDGCSGEFYDCSDYGGESVDPNAIFLTKTTVKSGRTPPPGGCSTDCATTGTETTTCSFDTDCSMSCSGDGKITCSDVPCYSYAGYVGCVCEDTGKPCSVEEPPCSGDCVPNASSPVTGSESLSDEYTTDLLVARTQAAMSPIPDLDSPPDPSDDVFATFQMGPDQSAVHITQSNYQFKWYPSPNLPQYKKITWLEIFYPADDPRTPEVEDTTPVTTVRSWEGTADETPIYYLSPTVQGSYSVTSFAAQMTVDGNRDGEMAFDVPIIYGPDQTSESRPYRFWLNDDDDTELKDDGSPAEAEQVPPNQPDYSKHKIVSKRNLEDFARVWINLGGAESALISGTLRIGLKWKTVDSGSPAINIYPSADGDGSESYLKEDDAAAAQINGVFSTAVTDQNNKQTVDSNSMFIFKTDYWNGLNANNGKKCFLFEGASEGKGELEVIFLGSSGTQIGEGASVWLDLTNLKKMYQRKEGYFPDYHSPYVQNPYNGNATANRDVDSTSFGAPPDEEDVVIVFVHGIHGPSFDQSDDTILARWYATSETAFKRLWWQGYKGRFASYKWAALQPAVPFEFNESEYRGWEFGDGFAEFVNAIPKSRKNLIAHSQGNTLCSYALRWGLITVENYAALQAAVPAGCYDPSADVNNYQKFLDAESDHGQTPDDTSEFGYRGYLSGLSVTGRVVNFENRFDYALVTGTEWGIAANWEANEVNYKPQTLADRAYYYDPSASDPLQLVVPGSGALIRDVDDHRESLGFLARPRSQALGAVGSAGGSVSSNIDLSAAPYSFTRESSDHSGEFERPIQRAWDFYETLFNVLE